MNIYDVILRDRIIDIDAIITVLLQRIDLGDLHTKMFLHSLIDHPLLLKKFITPNINFELSSHSINVLETVFNQFDTDLRLMTNVELLEQVFSHGSSSFALKSISGLQIGEESFNKFASNLILSSLSAESFSMMYFAGNVNMIMKTEGNILSYLCDDNYVPILTHNSTPIIARKSISGLQIGEESFNKFASNGIIKTEPFALYTLLPFSCKDVVFRLNIDASTILSRYRTFDDIDNFTIEEIDEMTVEELDYVVIEE